MQNDIINLTKEFNRIKKMGWIESMRRGSTGIGYTFETLLNKEENDFPIPDYNTIEIKTMRIRSKRNIHLFNATPDGDYLFSIERVLNNLGYPDRKEKKYKVFNWEIRGKEYTKIGYYKKATLIVNREKRKVDLIAYKDGKKLQLDTSWSFDLLKQKIELKVRYLALIRALSRKENDKEFFYYKDIFFYKIKSFDTFLNLINEGKIAVSFKINVYRKGIKKGQIDNHGTDFSIKERHIKELFNKIDL